MPRIPSSMVILAAAVAALLAACTEPPAGTDTAPVAMDQPAEDVPPATAPAAPAPAPAGEADAGEARYDGYGPLRFGMSAEAMRAAWKTPLNGEPGDDGPTGCHHLSPAGLPSPAHLALMLDGGRFVRYGTTSDTLAAPGGGKVGMTADGIRQRHPGAIAEQPHEYVEGGKYLRIPDPAGSGGVLLFETDAQSRVTQWRVGLPPQVDYVEGCS